jgi:hypothetical protein
MRGRSVYQHLAWALLACLILTLAACALTDAQRLDRVRPGMTPEQVESYMGYPVGVEFEFQSKNAWASYYFDKDTGENKGMTIARAIGPVSPMWPQRIRNLRTEMQAEYGTPTAICTVHRLGEDEYRCCFSGGRLISNERIVRPAPPLVR